MAKRNKKDKKTRIALSSYTKGGRISSLIALEAFILFVLTVALCIVQNGNAGIYVGILAWAIFGLALAGFVIGLKSYQEETKFLKYTYIGTISNAVIWIGILCVFLIYVCARVKLWECVARNNPWTSKPGRFAPPDIIYMIKKTIAG